ncbi:YoaK family protein [Mycetocola saprophilus]|uniref:YoaK family protein n=1 Tax=Mycetocola saprophilus TaxID=76636 RepID=UPI003BF24904
MTTPSQHRTGGVSHVALMLALTFSTGIIDAVGYVGLDRVFTGNMTGNVVLLGMALVGADHLPILGPVIALVCFMAGAALSGRLARGSEPGWTRRNTTQLGIVVAGLIACAVIVLTLPVVDITPLALTVTGLLGASMGLQAGAARHLAVADVTTVVVTSTLVGLAYDSVLGRGATHPWLRRALAVILIGLGAATGAWLHQFGLAPGILVAALITIVVAFLGHRGASRSETRA